MEIVDLKGNASLAQRERSCFVISRVPVQARREALICPRRLTDRPDGSGPSDVRSIRAGDTKAVKQPDQ